MFQVGGDALITCAWRDVLITTWAVDAALLEPYRPAGTTLDKEMKDYLTPSEIKTLLARRDLIVAHIEKSNAVFDWNRPARNYSAKVPTSR